MAAAAHAVSPPAPLNTFQRLVMQWDRMHPYNAGQVLKIAGPAQPARLAAAWQETLETLGLGRVLIDWPQIRHHTLNGESARYPIAQLPADTDLCDYLSTELNRPFDDPGEPPFRPFILDRGDHHYAGVMYHHWVADSVSIRLLLREWFFRMYAPERARRHAVKHACDGYWSLFGPHKTAWEWGDGLLSSVRWSSRNRRVARVEHPGYGDFNVRFSLHPVGQDLVPPLLAFAKAAGATLNDLFLAILAEVCRKFVPIRTTSRRTDLSLGTIVDLRPYSKQDLSDTFGLFLGFTSTLLRPDDLADFSRMLKSIATQSVLHKRTGVPLSSPVRMLAGLAVGRFLRTEKVVEFYRKRVPLAGGISNVNLNKSWAAEFHPGPLLDYVRVSPTGPMMPLVFTPTTLGRNLHVGLTFRPSLICPSKAGEMAGHFAKRLHEIAGV